MLKKEPNLYKYLPISQSDKDWGLWVTGSGFASIENGEQYPPAGHPSAYQLQWESGRRLQEFQLLYIVKGKGVFESEKTALCEVKEGTLIFLFPNIWHRYKPHSQIGWDEYWVGFNGDIVQKLLTNKFISPNQPMLFVGLDEDLLEKYIKLNLHLKEEPIGFNHLASAEIFSILAKMQSIEKNKSAGGTHIEDKINKAKVMIMQACETNLDVQEVAQSVNMGYEHFRRSFKLITGLAPYQYHLDHKINRAKELLLMTNMSVKLISDRLCFENQYYFSRVFKSKTGHPPSAWKNISSNRFSQKEIG
jgi:AraC-like DNA-binding protein